MTRLIKLGECLLPFSSGSSVLLLIPKLYIQKYKFTRCFVRVLNLWPVTVREEHRLRIYENRELRREFGPK